LKKKDDLTQSEMETGSKTRTTQPTKAGSDANTSIPLAATGGEKTRLVPGQT
jgi:hypothetical protein